MDNERLTWEQIKQKYPHQCVGLVDVEYETDEISVKSAIVKYTDKIMSYEELIMCAAKKEVLLRYTTSDEDKLKGIV